MQIHRCASRGDIAGIRFWAGIGQPVNSWEVSFYEMQTPLQFAAASRRAGVDVLQALLELGADLEPRRPDGRPRGESVLALACGTGSVDKVKFLLQMGHPPQPPVEFERPPVLAAARASEEDACAVVSVLLQAGADPLVRTARGEDVLETAFGLRYARMYGVLVRAAGDGCMIGWPRLVRAVMRGDSERARFLLHSAGREVNKLLPVPPLAVALRLGDAELCQLLIDAGATPELARWGNAGSLALAAESGNVGLLKRLMNTRRFGSDVEPGATSPLSAAARLGRVECVRVLLERGMNANLLGELGETALTTAMDAPTARLLIGHGADINHADEWLGTALMHSTVNDNEELLGELLQCEADPNKGADGTTPLHVAVRHDGIGMVRQLLHAGASVTVHDEDGRSPLAYVRSVEVRDQLLEAGAKPTRPLYFDSLASVGLVPEAGAT